MDPYFSVYFIFLESAVTRAAYAPVLSKVFMEMVLAELFGGWDCLLDSKHSHPCFEPQKAKPGFLQSLKSRNRERVTVVTTFENIVSGLRFEPFAKRV